MIRLFLLVLAILTLPAQSQAAPGPCATPQILPSLEAPRVFPGPAAGARNKDSRNPFAVPNELVTSDFVVRWGDEWQPNQAGIQTLSDALRDAWLTQIIELDHPAPPSTDTTRMNVYIGDTGDGTPSAFGAGGYFTTDEEGFPMLVINQNSLDDPNWNRMVALHEFYHSVQWGLGTYSYDEDSPGAWYWEATASWVPSVTDPQSATNGTFLFGFGLLPHHELDAFNSPDTGALDEYHQYGAFIFPTYLDEWVAGPAVIRDSWVSPVGGATDPIEALRGRLAQENIDFDDTFVDFVATNVFWDYAHRPTWEQNIEVGEQWYPNESPVTAWIPEKGTDGFESAPTSRKPRRYGSNVLRLDELGGGDWLLEARFDETGSQGSAASWGVTLVRNQGTEVNYQRIELLDLQDGLTIAAGGQLGVAVAAWSDVRRPGERFDWEWSVRPLVGGDDDGPPADAVDDDDAADDDESGGFNGSGCTCATDATPDPSMSWLLLLLYGTFAPRSRRS